MKILVLFLAVGISLTVSWTEEERKKLLLECKEDFDSRAREHPPKEGEESRECFDTCLCEKLGVITAEGELTKKMPDMMNETITQSQYDLLVKECNYKVVKAVQCKKSNVLLSCIIRVWEYQSFPCYGVAP